MVRHVEALSAMIDRAASLGPTSWMGTLEKDIDGLPGVLEGSKLRTMRADHGWVGSLIWRSGHVVSAQGVHFFHESVGAMYNGEVEEEHLLAPALGNVRCHLLALKKLFEAHTIGHPGERASQ